MKQEKVLVYAEIVNFLKENTFEFPIPTLKFKSLFWVRIVDGSIVVLTVQNKKYVISEATYNRFLERRITKNYQFFNRKEQYIISILRELLSLNLITSCGIFLRNTHPLIGTNQQAT
ncbi:hypothetical protein [Intestinicryptomonas porci]|uniref:Uncharacterized protein n=1 Tax=Intestinicryptomonas porci TaxID=2926320 RepID=A0ABU4WF78_9BACT|nr:hypothetical protein [Opitutales bacterium CLA-KB-P66]